MSKAKKILIVEDEMIIKALKLKFQREGFEAETALDGEEALAKLAGFTPDIILLDILMPKMDGFAFLGTLRRSGKLKSIPVIIFSNYSDTASIARAKEYAVAKYIVKSDVSIQELVEEVKKCINK